MHEVWGIAALRLGLALVATLVSSWLKIASALSEIIVGTVIALGLIFALFTIKTVILIVVSWVVFAVLPYINPLFFKKYGNRPSGLEAKYFLLIPFGLGSLAVWSGSEAVLPAYIIGMVLVGTGSRDHALIKHLPILTFGSISALFGLSHGIIDQEQYSLLIDAVIDSATEHYEDLFRGLRDRAKGQNIEIKTGVMVGHPADQIVRYAVDNACDMVVVGQRGKSKIETWLLGSVSKRVAFYAPCTVVIVK